MADVRSGRRTLRGFTLLEVLVAFLVLAMSLSVLMRLYSASFAALAAAERRQTALLLAESRMDEVLASLHAGRRGRETGTLQAPFRWSSEIEPFAFDAPAFERRPLAPAQARPPLGVRRISVSVSWGRNATERITLTTLRLVEEPR